VPSDVTPLGRTLRRIWSRAGIVCALLLAAALTLPRIQRTLDPGRDRRSTARTAPRVAREEAPVYVMPNGERRRAAVVTRPDPTPVRGSRGNSALFWWCGILGAATIAGAVAQTLRVYATREEEEEG
jgi:hypothetical protein